MDVPIRVTNDSDDAAEDRVRVRPLAASSPTGSLQDVIDLGPNGKGRKMLRLTADKLAGRRR